MTVLPLGTLLSLDFLYIIISWHLLDNSSPESTFSSSPEGILNGPGENLPACEVPGVVKGSWNLLGGRNREGKHSTVPKTRTCYAKMQTALHCWETVKSISRPPNHYFQTPNSWALCFNWGQISPKHPTPPSLSLRLCPLVLLPALHSSCCQDIPRGSAG